MTPNLLLGAILLAIGAGLIFIGLPDKNGESPRFLRFHSALVLYTPAVLVFLAGGSAAIVMALVGASQ